VVNIVRIIGEIDFYDRSSTSSMSSSRAIKCVCWRCCVQHLCVLGANAADRTVQRDYKDGRATDFDKQGWHCTSRLCNVVEYVSSAASAELATANTSAVDSCCRCFGQRRQVTVVMVVRI